MMAPLLIFCNSFTHQSRYDDKVCSIFTYFILYATCVIIWFLYMFVDFDAIFVLLSFISMFTIIVYIDYFHRINTSTNKSISNHIDDDEGAVEV